MSTQPAASQYGPTAATARWWAFVHERQLRCPAGHHIKQNLRIPESGIVRCQHWIQGPRTNGGQRECGLWVYALVVRGGRVIVAQVEPDEQDAMLELHTPAAILDYLGIFPSR